MDFLLNLDPFISSMAVLLPVVFKWFLETIGGERRFNRLNNRYYVEYLNRRLDIYLQLYLGVVRSPLGVSVPTDEQIEFIRSFISHNKHNQTLLFQLSTKLRSLLHSFIVAEEKELNKQNIVSDIAKLVDIEFNSIKQKLGYDNDYRINSRINKAYFLLVYFIVSFFYSLAGTLEYRGQDVSFLFYILLIFSALGIVLIWFYLNSNFTYIRETHLHSKKSKIDNRNNKCPHKEHQ